MFRAVVVITIVVLLSAVLIALIEDVGYVSLPKPKYLGPIQDRCPSNSNEFGRYTKPLPVLDYSGVSPSKLFNFTALKHWHFQSISTSRYFIAAAIANFNYVAHGFVYVIDRLNRDQSFYQYESRSVLARTIQEQAESSIDGCTHFYHSSSEYIRLCYDKTEKVYHVDLNVPMKNNVQVAVDCKISYSDEKDRSMVLLYPVENNRPAYTHKMAGSLATGHITVGNTREKESLDGLGSMDWTLAYSERLSHWKWGSLSVLGMNSSDNAPVIIGINLSDSVYDDENGVSMEAAVWIAGQVYTVEQMVYELPDEQNLLTQPWHIYSAENTSPKSPKIRLNFQPWGSQEEHINVLFLAGDFVQAFGVYNGTIELFDQTYIIENGFGVAENHYAKW